MACDQPPAASTARRARTSPPAKLAVHAVPLGPQRLDRDLSDAPARRIEELAISLDERAGVGDRTRLRIEHALGEGPLQRRLELVQGGRLDHLEFDAVLGQDLAFMGGGLEGGLAPVEPQHAFALDERSGISARRKMHMRVESAARQPVERGRGAAQGPHIGGAHEASDPRRDARKLRIVEAQARIAIEEIVWKVSPQAWSRHREERASR